MSKSSLIRSLLGMAVFALAWFPVLATHTTNTPAQDPKYIRRVFADHSVGQKMTFSHHLHAIDIIARSSEPRTALIIAQDEHRGEISRRALDLTPTDQWHRINIDPPLEPGDHTITFHTLPDTTQSQAILIRFQIQSDRYEDGHMVVDGQPSYGDIGFHLRERMPLWRAITLWGQITDVSTHRGLLRILAGFCLGIILIATSNLIFGKKNHAQIAYTLLIFLAVATIAIRLPYLHLIEGIFGGDAFNYLLKTQALLQGHDPFAADARKGPLYPLLLIPAFFLSDPLTWSRLVGIAAAAATAVITPFIARNFGAPWGIALGSGLLLAVNQDFIWESPNGLANTLYVALIAAAVLAYVKASNPRWQWLLAIFSGLVFLTRFEGAIVAAILLPALWWRERLPWRRAAVLIITTLAIMAIPQLSLLWSGSSGIRTPDDLVADSGLSLATSKPDLINNLHELYRFTTSAWATPESGHYTVPALIAGALISLAILLASKRWPSFWNHVAPLAAPTLLIALVILMLTKSSAAHEYLIALPWLFMGLGLIPWLRSGRYNAGVIWLLLILHTVAITLILPKTRYYLPLIPFMSLSLAFGIHSTMTWSKSRLSQIISYVFLGLTVSYLYADGTESLQKLQLEKYNSQASHTTVMIQAVRHLRTQPGNIGFRTGDELPIITYIPTDRRFFFSDTPGKSVVQAELNWIREHSLRYIVERNDESSWQSVDTHSDAFEHLHTFTTIYGESRVTVYGVHRGKLREIQEAAVE